MEVPGRRHRLCSYADELLPFSLGKFRCAKSTGVRLRPVSLRRYDQVLLTALKDRYWEVRVTALLAAVRIGAVNLVKHVAAAKLPESTSEGVNADERRMLQSIRKYAIALLQGEPVPALREPPHSRESMRSHLMRCMLGLPVEDHDRTFLFITAMYDPLPAGYPMPDALPPGMTVAGEAYRLQSHGIDLVWRTGRTKALFVKSA